MAMGYDVCDGSLVSAFRGNTHRTPTSTTRHTTIFQRAGDSPYVKKQSERLRATAASSRGQLDPHGCVVA